MKFFKTIVLLLTMIPLAGDYALGWGGTGHSAVAQVAYNHLNSTAKQNLMKYLEGRTIVEVASDADNYRPTWLRDFGVDITNPEDFRLSGWKDFDYGMPAHIEPWTHSFCIDDESRECFGTDLMPSDPGKYMGLNNCVLYIDRFSREIKEKGADAMRPDSLMIKICLMVHWFGDMHCPMHIQYYPGDMSKSGNFYYKGTKKSLHNFWDSEIFNLALSGKNYKTIASEAESFEAADYGKITAGDIWNWGPACAYQARAGRMVNGERISEETTVPDDFPQTVLPVCLRQIRDGGYRLAALFNELFGK